jgi:hypothetical protein
VSTDKITLREALDKGELGRFIAEREDQPHADQEAFEATLSSMVGKSKSEPETSPPDCDDD